MKFSDKELLKYAKENYKNLSKVHLKGYKECIFYLVNVDNGWCTCYVPGKNTLVHGWACDFVWDGR